MNVRVHIYRDRVGNSPYLAWFDSLPAAASLKVATAVFRLQEGNFSNVKGVGGGLMERRVDFGPGYRIYFGKDGDTLVVLLGGSSKERQSQAIFAAQARWADYRARKRGQR
jgi:putative addiction module killer protein